MNNYKYINVKSSKIHGRGVYASVDIPEGTLIIQYIGEKITKEEAEKRAETIQQEADKYGTGAVYIFELDDEYDIDGNVDWNPARLINHACETNCEAQIIDNEIWIVATKNIKKSEELHYDYGYDLEDWQSHPCHCKKSNCIGFIAGVEYREELMHSKKYKNMIKDH